MCLPCEVDYISVKMFLVAGGREDNLNGQELCKNSQALRVVNSFAMMWLEEEVIARRPEEMKAFEVYKGDLP